MSKKEFFEAAGVDYDAALSRFMGNEGLLTRFLKKFMDDPNFLNLQGAIDKGDVDAAFRAAHTLKGVAGNLSLSELYNHASKIADMLRGGDLEGAKAMMPEVQAAYRKITDALKD